MNVVPKLTYFPVSKFVKQNNKNGNSSEITVFNQNSERRGSIFVNEFRENERKREIEEENIKKTIQNKTDPHEKEVENETENKNGDENNDENKDDVEVKMEQTSRRKKTGQFKDVLRRSRSFSFSQKLARKNLEEKNNLNDDNNRSVNTDNNDRNDDKRHNDNNNINISNNTISDNNININISKSYSFKSQSIVHSPYLLASTMTEGKLKLRALNSDDRLVWVTWLLSVIQSQQAQH